jgi:hypothetical protein
LALWAEQKPDARQRCIDSSLFLNFQQNQSPAYAQKLRAHLFGILSTMDNFDDLKKRVNKNFTEKDIEPHRKSFCEVANVLLQRLGAEVIPLAGTYLSASSTSSTPAGSWLDNMVSSLQENRTAFDALEKQSVWGWSNYFNKVRYREPPFDLLLSFPQCVGKVFKE